MKNVFIFHGTEGHPQENWFPWLNDQLKTKGIKVFAPQFPSPPIIPASITEWFDVLKKYEQNITQDSILIGHSLGGVFALRILEKRNTINSKVEPQSSRGIFGSSARKQKNLRHFCFSRSTSPIKHPVKAVFLVGTPIGVKPILNYDRDNSFSGFDFDWETIKTRSEHFVVYQSGYQNPP